MQKTLLILLVPVVILMPTAVWASETQDAGDAKAALEKVQQAAEGITSFEADMKISMSVMNQPMEMVGHIVVLKPDRMRMKMTVPPQGEMEIVSDGTTTWTYMPMMNLVQKIDNAAIKQMPGMGGPPGGGQMNDPSKALEQLDPDTLRLVGEETVDGQACYVFEGDLPEQARGMAPQFAPQKMKVWLAQADSLSRKMEGYGSDGTTMMTMTFANVKTNVQLAEDHFTFTPPPGAQVMDMSQAVQSMMENLQGAPLQAPSVPPQE